MILALQSLLAGKMNLAGCEVSWSDLRSFNALWMFVFGGGTRYGISELEVRAWQGVGVCRVQVGVKVSGVDLVNDQGKY